MGTERRRVIYRILTAASLCLNGSLPARDVAGLFEDSLLNPAPSQIIEYKSVGETSLSLHVFEPEKRSNGPRAAIIWLHGGGWENGDPNQLFPHCAYFAKLGYVAISAEYRLARDGNTVFDCIEDSRDAFYWVYENAAALNIDPTHIIIGGESAGGHLAACVGYIPDPRNSGIPDPEPRPRACLLVNPIVDLTTLFWALTKPGLSPDDVPLAESISPLHFVDAADPPAILLHGESDSVVPHEQSEDFAAALHAVSRPTNLRIWAEKGHAFFLYLPQFGLEDKGIIQFSLLEIEAFLQAEGLNGYPIVDGHFSPVHLFAGSDGFRSFSELIQSGDLLYGSTYRGGPSDDGTLFKFNPTTREHTVLHAFSDTDGREAFNGLAIDGSTLYGVCKFGGDFNQGTLFSINTDGSEFQILHHFSQDAGTGFYPHSAPVLVNDILYGTTYHGGTNTWSGVVYRYPLPNGPYQVLSSFSSSTGQHPTGQLIAIGDWLYGTASDLFEHDNGYHGAIYRIDRLTGFHETLYTFNGTSEGSHPYDDLYYDGIDTLYGTTFGQAGNPDSKGTVFAYSIPNDTLSVLHDFETNAGTGSKPNGGLIAIDSSGFLYGLSHGSNDANGEIGFLFRLRTDGTDFTLLHEFSSGLNGNTPMRSPVYVDGAFYGVTAFGGLTSDTSNPETGGGFIFRYEPVENPSASRTAYIEWLVSHGLLVNQAPGNNLDADALSLIEEFAFGGDPFGPDGTLPELTPTFPDGLQFKIKKVRASAISLLEPLESSDLQDWSAAAGFTLNVTDHPTDGPEFQVMTYGWPISRLEAGPFFLQLKLGLEQ